MDFSYENLWRKKNVKGITQITTVTYGWVPVNCMTYLSYSIKAQLAKYDKVIIKAKELLVSV